MDLLFTVLMDRMVQSICQIVRLKTKALCLPTSSDYFRVFYLLLC